MPDQPSRKGVSGVFAPTPRLTVWALAGIATSLSGAFLLVLALFGFAT
ncbi:hypothetical protein [Roseitranquillus sediminis]|nr:hypothetical protein [Roseitranquillus sediminis]MBM9593693.1 hypothetical protein [Roseitranquillus sediminis]